jgi:phosphatidylglycerophosphatase A
MKFAAKLIATFFGVGFVPIAPGTAASAIVVLVYRTWLHALSLPRYLAVLAVVIIVGTWASDRAARAFGSRDPRMIVADEVAGQMAALALCPVAWIPLLVGFASFRLFDILKPFPIRRIERWPGGWGIMADDLAAGLAGFLVLRLLLVLT